MRDKQGIKRKKNEKKFQVLLQSLSIKTEMPISNLFQMYLQA
jgi:hypothetical protein